MHLKHEKIESDCNFETGTLAHIVCGNEGRVLDGRRTPGYIESYDENSALFVWRITDFEDKGKCWEIPAEQISSYQFRRGSKMLVDRELESITKRCEALNKDLNIDKRASDRANTEELISQCATEAILWIQNNSRFIRDNEALDFCADTGSKALFSDLEEYMDSLGLREVESMTAEQYLLNPYSGEWIKGLKIVMAEMGLISYHGKILRRPDHFSGLGSKEILTKYIAARAAFLRCIFMLKGISEVPLYRGMSSELDFYKTPETLVSASFSSNVAMSFAGLNSDTTSRSAYVVKFHCNIQELFMTYLETRAFSGRYKEQEAIIIYNGQFSI